jgi:hypothetical protein
MILIAIDTEENRQTDRQKEHKSRERYKKTDRQKETLTIDK